MALEPSPSMSYQSRVDECIAMENVSEQELQPLASRPPPLNSNSSSSADTVTPTESVFPSNDGQSREERADQAQSRADQEWYRQEEEQRNRREDQDRNRHDQEERVGAHEQGNRGDETGLTGNELNVFVNRHLSPLKVKFRVVNRIFPCIGPC